MKKHLQALSNRLKKTRTFISILEKIDTEKIQIQRQIISVYVLTEFISQTFTTLVYDNMDRREETMSGSNTSHRVNGIIIQPCKYISFSDTDMPVHHTPKRQFRRSVTGYDYGKT